MSRGRTEARLQHLVEQRLEPEERIVGWARVWYSRTARPQALAARYRDIVVLTDRRLLMYEVGYFTRRPRRRVLADRLDELTVEDVSTAPERARLRFSKPAHRTMLLEFDRGEGLGAQLLAAAGRRIDASTVAPEPESESESAPEPETAV
jgi:hypothetical protein